MDVTPADLIVRAKRLSAPVASCVRAQIRPDHLMAGLSWEELAALVIVLADAADPYRLRNLSALPGDEGLPAGRDEVLRAAHAHVWHLRQAGQPVPLRLGLLENEYHVRSRRRRGCGDKPRQREEGTVAA